MRKRLCVGLAVGTSCELLLHSLAAAAMLKKIRVVLCGPYESIRFKALPTVHQVFSDAGLAKLPGLCVHAQLPASGSGLSSSQEGPGH